MKNCFKDWSHSRINGPQSRSNGYVISTALVVSIGESHCVSESILIMKLKCAISNAQKKNFLFKLSIRPDTCT